MSNTIKFRGFRVDGKGNGIDEAGKSATLKFSAGGQQGGRNWCRCDQCTYAGAWCGQHKTPPDHTDTRLISGDWYVEVTPPSTLFWPSFGSMSDVPSGCAVLRAALPSVLAC